MEIIYSEKNFFTNTKAEFLLSDAEVEYLGKPDYISYKKRWINTILYEQCNDDEAFPEEKYNIVGWGKTDENMVQILTNEISSMYWYTDNGVFRYSNHWGDIASCEWSLLDAKKTFLSGEKQYIFGGADTEPVIGYCHWSMFEENCD